MHTDFIQTILKANKISIPPVYQTNKPRPLFPFVRFSAPILQNISPACPSGKLLPRSQVFHPQKHTPVTILFSPKKNADRGGIAFPFGRVPYRTPPTPRSVNAAVLASR